MKQINLNFNNILRVIFWTHVFAFMLYSANYFIKTDSIETKTCYNLYGVGKKIDDRQSYETLYLINGYNKGKRYFLKVPIESVYKGYHCYTDNSMPKNTNHWLMVSGLISIVLFVVFGLFLVIPWALGQYDVKFNIFHQKEDRDESR